MRWDGDASTEVLRMNPWELLPEGKTAHSELLGNPLDCIEPLQPAVGDALLALLTHMQTEQLPHRFWSHEPESTELGARALDSARDLVMDGLL